MTSSHQEVPSCKWFSRLAAFLDHRSAPRLVLQRRVSRPTSHAPPQLGGASLAMAGGGLAIPLPPPVGPPQDFVHVPHANVQQVDEESSHFGHGHLWLFFPPVVLAGAQGTSGPASRALCDDANLPSRGSRIRRGRILPWPTECPPRSSTVSHAPLLAFSTAHPPAHSNGDTSALALGPAIVVPATAPWDRVILLR